MYLFVWSRSVVSDQPFLDFHSSPNQQFYRNCLSVLDAVKSIDLYNIEYKSPTLSSKQIQTFVGNVNKTEKEEVKPYFRALPIPNLELVKEFRSVSSFNYH
jgi:hypothetical protein